MLLRENAELKARVAQLESELAFLKMYPTIAQGIKGEMLVCRLTGGTTTSYNLGHDVVTPDGARIEVKFSKIQRPNKRTTTRRWNWSNLLGWRDKSKNYDFLLLIGDKDPRFLSQYLNDGSPYVFFLIPIADVPSVLSKGRMMGSQAQINTNLDNARSVASRAIKKFMVPSAVISSERIIRDRKEYERSVGSAPWWKGFDR